MLQQREKHFPVQPAGGQVSTNLLQEPLSQVLVLSFIHNYSQLLQSVWVQSRRLEHTGSQKYEEKHMNEVTISTLKNISFRLTWEREVPGDTAVWWESDPGSRSQSGPDTEPSRVSAGTPHYSEPWITLSLVAGCSLGPGRVLGQSEE